MCSLINKMKKNQICVNIDLHRLLDYNELRNLTLCAWLELSRFIYAQVGLLEYLSGTH